MREIKMIIIDIKMILTGLPKDRTELRKESVDLNFIINYWSWNKEEREEGAEEEE